MHGPGPYRLEIASVTEERLEKGWFFVRFRIRPHLKPSGLAAIAANVALIPLAFLKPCLLPLGLPILVTLGVLLASRRAMTRAISQLAIDVAAPLGMTPAQEEP